MKRIAFIDRELDVDNSVERERFEENEFIVKGLQELYEVTIYFGIDESETCRKVIEDSRDQGDYHAIITHVRPQIISKCSLEIARGHSLSWDECREMIYKSSFDNIKAIHYEFPETQIIAYTRAPFSGLAYVDFYAKLRGCGVSCLLKRRYELTDEQLRHDMETFVEWLE